MPRITDLVRTLNETQSRMLEAYATSHNTRQHSHRDEFCVNPPATKTTNANTNARITWQWRRAPTWMWLQCPVAPAPGNAPKQAGKHICDTLATQFFVWVMLFYESMSLQ